LTISDKTSSVSRYDNDVERDVGSRETPLCTILVPLKDNVHRTRHFLENNDFSEFQFIFADGSLGNENEKLFNSVERPYISYMRFPADISLTQYLEKMAVSAERVTTPFMMTMDAGDYLLPKGVNAAVKSLLNETTASTSSGDPYSAREIGPFMTTPHMAISAAQISGQSLEAALAYIRVNYCYLWYAIHRSEVFKNTWSLMAREKFKHPYMEYFPTLSALAEGHYIDTGIPSLLRVIDRPRSWTKQPSDMHLDSLVSDVVESTSNFAERCSVLLGVNSKLVVHAFELNAAAVIASKTPQTLGPKWFACLMPSNSAIHKFPFLYNLERAIGHYIGLILPTGPGVGYFSGFRWSYRNLHLRKLRNSSASTKPRH